MHRFKSEPLLALDGGLASLAQWQFPYIDAIGAARLFGKESSCSMLHDPSRL
jgi:hypothetical protein